MEDLRSLPKIDRLAAAECLDKFPPRVRTEAARLAVAEIREGILSGDLPSPSNIEKLAEEHAILLTAPSLHKVINMSGVILHTGLGRARLAKDAVSQLTEAASYHSSVEIDMETGGRGDRQSHVKELLRELTGAEDALVVNNAAAAVFLSLNALASAREVILSRGQMVEIGGSFRLPDIVRQSGCRLVEVGCTNKTRLGDYESAVGEDTAAVLRCHPSNFKIVGFTSEPSAEEIAGLCHRLGLQLIDDVGSGCILDLSAFGLSKQPTLQDSVKAGADVVIASGDKLLGGPQAGLILGKAEVLATIRSHPLARAVRVDKLTLAAMEATLRLYAIGRESEIPTIRYLSRTAAQVRELAERLASSLKDRATVEEGFSEVGGGSLPGEGLPTYRVCISHDQPETLAKSLRVGEPSIFGYIERDKVCLDPRTVEEDELHLVENRLRELII